MLLDRNFNVSTADLEPVSLDEAATRSIEQFIDKEVRLLDGWKFWEWDKLFTDDGMYWVPHLHQQDNPYEP